MSRIGWYEASDGMWYRSEVPPAAGWWLASDDRWYPPSATTWPPAGGAWPAGDEPPGEPWRRSRWGLGDFWWGILVVVVGSLVLGVGIVFVLMAVQDSSAADVDASGVYAVSFSILANVLGFGGVPWWASRRKGLRSLAADFGLAFRPVDLAIGLGVGIGALIAGGLVASGLEALLDPSGDSSNVPVDDLHGPGQIIAFALAVAVLTPIVEELFFRGLLHRSLLKRGMGPWPAMFVTTMIFVLPHLLSVPEWPNVVILFAAITVFGSSFHLACRWTGNRLGAPIVAHMVVNGVSVLALAWG